MIVVCFLLTACLWLLFSHTFAQSSAGIFGQLSLPTRNYGQQFESRPLPYANTLWPFPSAYPNNRGYSNNGEGYMGGQQQQQPAPGRPYYYQPYDWSPMPQQQQFQQQQQPPLTMNDLIAELSVALVRSFAQMLAEREIGGGAGGGNAGFSSNNFGGPAAPIGQQARNGGIFGGFPFAQQPPQPPQFPGRTSTNYGYGVNAGVFAGSYGGSDSIASPYGPYGPGNSEIGGGPYSGLSPWPIVPARPVPPQQPQTTTNSSTRPAGQQQPQQPQPQPPAGGGGGPVVGEGSVVQIPISDNVQTGGAEGSGGGELPVPAEGGTP